MSATLEHKLDNEMNAVDKIAAIPTATGASMAADPIAESSKEDIAEIKKAFKTVLAIAGGLFLLAMLFSRRTEPPTPVAAPAPTSVSVPVAPALVGTPGGSVVSYPEELTAHHLYDQDYSLTWKSMGEQYTYRVYYANDKQMHDATAALYKPVEGTMFRFTMNGDPKNVWMAVTPVNGTNEEGLLSRPINIGQARKG